MESAPLQVFAGARAREHLRHAGLRAEDVWAVPGAAGGPKGLVLNPLDRHLFGHWLPQAHRTVHLLGASIGAWRLAAACLPDAPAALARLAADYIGERYGVAPGTAPGAHRVSRVFGRTLAAHFDAGGCAAVLAHPHFRLHVFTSRGRRLLAAPGRWRTPLGYAAAFASNAWARAALGGWLQRVVFSDPRTPLPLVLDAELGGTTAALTRVNLVPAVQASCSIPFAMEPVLDVPGGPPGTYWDGGLTDYHLHLDYAAAAAGGIVLYPHFQPRVVPGWLDKPFGGRHRASARLDNVVVLAPHPDWIARLPGGKLPDRSDFQRYRAAPVAREGIWRRALAESERLADAFDALTRLTSVAALPLP
ncbi:MAG: patatin-like phospholipase family protein [Rubrivivax sp.]